MATRYGLQAIYLRLEPASYKFLESIRSQFDGPDPRPEPLCAIPIIFDLVHSPLQEKQLEDVLSKLSSTIPPFSVQLCNPFRNRNWDNELKAVHYSLRSEIFNMLHKELQQELRDLLVLKRHHGVLRTTRFQNLTIRTAFRPKITIKSKLCDNAADSLVLSLKAKYGDEPGSLAVQGLSMGQQRGELEAVTPLLFF